jgi:hypothetical protein
VKRGVNEKNGASNARYGACGHTSVCARHALAYLRHRNHFSFVARMLITAQRVGFFEREFIEPGRARPPPDVFPDVISAEKADLIDTRRNSVNRMMND